MENSKAVMREFWENSQYRKPRSFKEKDGLWYTTREATKMQTMYLDACRRVANLLIW